MLHPLNTNACARYYYLSARNGNHAEIIEVLNGHQTTVGVPMWEEDVVLEPFYTRPMTAKEAQACKGSETWKLFFSWDKLYADHQKYGVEEHELTALEDYRKKLTLSDGMMA